ncbi:hypothetical protein APUTEX25_000517 [Auxenochlorella protothecoides]|uniref:Uncharacterized protein n=1 Tax=Auxenochlorella protothecoides TaxID=3075 RepID=A0A3M7KYV9_AUXPR|nr:hypothetical protein APUTEX25_000517 [Auxenochlorella protothecoides]|eukprot:RMZ55000.1 hypothetical protein APUTEX25_000517 [Auxenochlorella protothecoides]
MTLKASVNVVLGGHWGSAKRLLQAAERGDAATVTEVLNAHPQLAAFGGFNSSSTPLHRAAEGVTTTTTQNGVPASTQEGVTTTTTQKGVPAYT